MASPLGTASAVLGGSVLGGSVLGLDDGDLASCVQCGLCLPQCPTYRVSGREDRSPRGRIAAMRHVDHGTAVIDAGFVEAMDTCVGCLGCETACPSAVPFGRLMEATRTALASDRSLHYQPWWQRLAMRSLAHPLLLRSGALALAVAQRIGAGGALQRLNLPRLPLRRGSLRSTGDDVVLVTGCVMDVVQRDVHAAAVRVLTASGIGVHVQDGAGCCGALSAHAGLRDTAARQASALIGALPADVPVVVDSAGCGAALKNVGHLLGTAEAEAFARRVVDVCEYLASRVEYLPEPADGLRPPVVAVQDPCHLVHAQRVHQAVRSVLQPYADIRELDDDGLCCGAGGAFSFRHPADARAVRVRKLAAIERTGAPVVASANPGCALHLQAAGLAVRHPVQIIDDRIGGAHGR